MLKLLTKPCRDNLVGLQRKLYKLEDGMIKPATIAAVNDCILFSMDQTSQIDDGEAGGLQ